MARRILILPVARQQLLESRLWCLNQADWMSSARWPIETMIESLTSDAEKYPHTETSVEVCISLRQMEVGLLRKSTHRILYDIQDDDVVVYAVRPLLVSTIA